MEPIKQTSSFVFNRFWLVTKRYWRLNQQNWLTGLAVAAGVLFSIWLLLGFHLFDPSEQPGGVNMTELITGPAIFIYMFGGLALTSMMFKEVHTRSRAYQFLTLPASASEKYAAAWFTSSLAYTVLAMAAILSLSFIVELITAIRMSDWSHFNLFNPFTSSHLETIGNYFFYHSIFFLGAIYFRSNNFLKTVLVIVIFFIGMFFIVAISGLFLTFFMADQVGFSVDLNEMAEKVPVIFWELGRLIFIGMMLLFGFLQLRNKQIA